MRFQGTVGVITHQYEPEPIMGQLVYYGRPKPVAVAVAIGGKSTFVPLYGETLWVYAVGIDHQPILLGTLTSPRHHRNPSKRRSMVRTLIVALGAEHRERLRPIP